MTYGYPGMLAFESDRYVYAAEQLKCTPMDCELRELAMLEEASKTHPISSIQHDCIFFLQDQLIAGVYSHYMEIIVRPPFPSPPPRGHQVASFEHQRYISKNVFSHFYLDPINLSELGNIIMLERPPLYIKRERTLQLKKSLIELGGNVPRARLSVANEHVQFPARPTTNPASCPRRNGRNGRRTNRSPRILSRPQPGSRASPRNLPNIQLKPSRTALNDEEPDKRVERKSKTPKNFGRL